MATEARQSSDHPDASEVAQREGAGGRRTHPGPFGLLGSFRYAGRGVVRTVSTQRNMRIHTVSAIMVMLLGMALPLDLASRTALLFCVTLVFFAEILNTALEAFVDLHVKEQRKEAMIAKDAAAAGVLILATATVAILVAILCQSWEMVLESMASIAYTVAFGLPLIITVSLLLWRARAFAWRFPLFLVTLSLSAPLWARSNSHVFSVCLAGLLLLAALSKPSRQG